MSPANADFILKDDLGATHAVTLSLMVHPTEMVIAAATLVSPRVPASLTTRYPNTTTRSVTGKPIWVDAATPIEFL